MNTEQGAPMANLKVRKIPPQNIVSRLCTRELFYGKPGTQFLQARQFYTNIFPNFTVANVEKPPCFLRKFSPDGKYFVAFSSDQTSLEIYEFQGPAAAENLIQGCNDTTFSSESSSNETLKAKLFDVFFKLKHTTAVASNGEHLNRECSLFSDCGKFIIVGSAAYLPETSHPHFYQIYRNNESVPPGTRFPLEDYTLHIVELESGFLTDIRHFKCDRISLAHNQGLYLYKDTLAVLSMQQQTIHVFQVTQSGKLVDVRSIGRFCYEDDQLLINSVRDSIVTRPFQEQCINCLKHRLLVFLYKTAFRQSQEVKNATPLLKFYQYFDQFKGLRIWKMQLLDENHLLIKYASEGVVTLNVTDLNSQPSFFVVYNIMTTEIVSVFENTSEELLTLFENFCDQFRNATLQCEAQFACSTSSNLYARQIHQRLKQTIINAKYGGYTEAVRRLLAQLPISSQSYSGSPYLDLALFSYDDKWVSVMERPKSCGDHPIRYYVV